MRLRVLSTLIRWIAIYPVDSVIQPLSNRGLDNISLLLRKISKLPSWLETEWLTGRGLVQRLPTNISLPQSSTVTRSKMVAFYETVLSHQNAPVLAPVVQRLDNAIHRINRYPADKC